MMDARESSFSDEAEQTEFGVRTGEHVQFEYERARRVFRSERRLGHPTGFYLQLDLSVGLDLHLMATLLKVTCQMWLDGLRAKKCSGMWKYTGWESNPRTLRRGNPSDQLSQRAFR